ncbi:MAG: hypothetical protein Q9207_001895 [Kuettlingeria erythrocarpa]
MTFPSTSSATGIDKIVNAIESLSNLLSALSPEEVAAHQQTITPRASHLVSQLTAIANSTGGDQAGPAKPSSAKPPNLTKQSARSPTHAQVEAESASSDSQLDGTISPVPANPLKRPSGSPPLSSQTQQERPPPTSTSPSAPSPPAAASTSNSLAALFAERGARLESQQRQRKADEQQEARTKAKARLETLAADPAKAEQRKHAEEVKKRMGAEKAQKELLRKRIEEDRKVRQERNEQARLRRGALAVDGAVPAAKRVQIVGGEIRAVGEKKKRDGDGDGDSDDEEMGE